MTTTENKLKSSWDNYQTRMKWCAWNMDMGRMRRDVAFLKWSQHQRCKKNVPWNHDFPVCQCPPFFPLPVSSHPSMRTREHSHVAVTAVSRSAVLHFWEEAVQTLDSLCSFASIAKDIKHRWRLYQARSWSQILGDLCPRESLGTSMDFSEAR